MTRPKRSDAYPASMLSALIRALESGEFFIPCDSPQVKPASLRLHFYGLLGALRNEGKPEFADSLMLVLSSEPPGLWIRGKDLSPIGELVSAALGAALPGENPPLPEEDPEDIFDRIMKGKML